MLQTDAKGLFKPRAIRNDKRALFLNAVMKNKYFKENLMLSCEKKTFFKLFFMRLQKNIFIHLFGLKEKQRRTLYKLITFSLLRY